jgi:hypothetical protein
MTTIEGHLVETATEDGLFDGSQYDLPIPALDGHKADTLRIAVGGAIDLDLYDENALAFLQSLKLGRSVDLTVTFTVSGSAWRHTAKGDDETDHVVHQVALKAHSIELPEA